MIDGRAYLLDGSRYLAVCLYGKDRYQILSVQHDTDGTALGSYETLDELPAYLHDFFLDFAHQSGQKALNEDFFTGHGRLWRVRHSTGGLHGRHGIRRRRLGRVHPRGGLAAESGQPAVVQRKDRRVVRGRLLPVRARILADRELMTRAAMTGWR